MQEVELVRDQPFAEICRKPGTSEATRHRCRKQYGGVRVNHLKRLKVLELENSQLCVVGDDEVLKLVVVREIAGKPD